MSFEHHQHHTSESHLLLSQAFCGSPVVDVFPKWVLETEYFILFQLSYNTHFLCSSQKGILACYMLWSSFRAQRPQICSLSYSMCLLGGMLKFHLHDFYVFTPLLRFKAWTVKAKAISHCPDFLQPH